MEIKKDTKHLEIGKYNDPSGAPHVRTKAFWFVKVNGSIAYKTTTKRDAIWYKESIERSAGR